MAWKGQTKGRESPAGASRGRRGRGPSYPEGSWGQHPKAHKHWWKTQKAKPVAVASPAPQEAGGDTLLGEEAGLTAETKKNLLTAQAKPGLHQCHTPPFPAHLSKQ